MSKCTPIPTLSQLGSKNPLTLIEGAQQEAQRVDRYLSWGKLQYRTPPSGLSTAEWWLGLKLHRMAGREPINLTDRRGEHFTYSINRMMNKLLHEIDMNCGGRHGALLGQGLSHQQHGRYLTSSLMEESIMSSLLEGAMTTRDRAKKMLQHRRKPHGENERMVMNNYETMQRIREIKDEAFSIERILELHRCLTHDCLDDPSRVGAFRCDEDHVRVEDSRSGEVIHEPPPADELPARMAELCEFANEQTLFIHPILKACMIHFWLAYDHPFIDGNGRTARALFYWSMLRAGYSFFEYISLSREIYRSPKSYYQSFVNAEEDERDLNYFLIDQLCTIQRAVGSLLDYVARKKEQQQHYLSAIQQHEELNYRQKNIIAYCLKNPDDEMSVTSIAQEFGTARQTARTDLQGLVEVGLLRRIQRGKSYYYRPSPEIEPWLRRGEGS